MLFAVVQPMKMVVSDNPAGSKAGNSRQWTQKLAKSAGVLRQLLRLGAMATIVGLILGHREELQHLIGQNVHRIFASRDMTPDSGSLRGNAVTHEDEVNQASQ